MRQYEKADLKGCRLTRLEIADLLRMRYTTFNAKLNGYLNFAPEELQKLRAIVRENQKEVFVNQ